MKEIVINFFAGLGIIESVILFVGGIILIKAIRNSEE